MKNVSLIIALTMAMLSLFNTANAMHYQIRVHGVPVTCTGSNGQLVPFYTDQKAALAARPLGGARADYSFSGYSIALDLSVMNSLNPLGAFFVIYHECAHVALPMGVGMGSLNQEHNADCHAIQSMKKHGLISSHTDFNKAASSIVQIDGAHQLSQQRIQELYACFVIAEPIAKEDTSKPKNMGKVLMGSDLYNKHYGNDEPSDSWSPTKYQENEFMIKP